MRKQEPRKGLNGWVAELSDGSVARESDGAAWGDVKATVVGLSLRFNGATIRLPSDAVRYFQRHSGSCELDGTGLKVASRTVGFESPSGTVVSLTASEDDGAIDVEAK